MNARLESPPTAGLAQMAGHLRLEFGYVTVTAISELFRELAVTCIHRQATRVLIVAGDYEPAGERSLRDALRMMALAGIPEGFRLALVTPRPSTAHTYRNTQRDFSGAGITTRLFDNEDDALHWLESARGQARL